MKNEKLLYAIGKINDDFISSAATNTAKRKLPKKVTWSAVAACLAICAFSAVYLLNSYLPSTSLVSISQKGYNAQFLSSDSIESPMTIKVDNQLLGETPVSELPIYFPSGTSAFKTADLYLRFIDNHLNLSKFHGHDRQTVTNKT